MPTPTASSKRGQPHSSEMLVTAPAREGRGGFASYLQQNRLLGRIDYSKPIDLAIEEIKHSFPCHGTS